MEKVADTKGDVEGQITYWWSCRMLSNDIQIATDEISDAAFFGQQEMEKIKLWPATQSFFRKYIFKEK